MLNFLEAEVVSLSSSGRKWRLRTVNKAEGKKLVEGEINKLVPRWLYFVLLWNRPSGIPITTRWKVKNKNEGIEWVEKVFLYFNWKCSKLVSCKEPTSLLLPLLLIGVCVLYWHCWHLCQHRNWSHQCCCYCYRSFYYYHLHSRETMF